MTPRILIVDDSLTVLKDLEEAFLSAGFAPVLAPNLTVAREQICSSAFDLIVLDLLLPEGDGLSFLKELREAPATASIPVMLLSTEAEVKDRIRGLAKGADEYVGKPYDASYMVTRAGEMIRSRAKAAPSSQVTVLVIDDSRTSREDVKEVLTSAGYEVLLAATGEEGLHLAAARRPDAAIIDAVLPGIDGLTVLRRIRADAALRRMACLMLSGSPSQGEIQGLDAGADAYLHKGQSPAVILARLAALLRATSTPAAIAQELSAIGPRRLLAIDDSPTFLEELSAQLRQDGYEVVMASSGEQAIDLLEVQLVDLILLDLMMPGLSGQETCRRIKSVPAWRDIPLVMLTGRESSEAMLEGLNAGADDFIAKSSDFTVLKGRLRAQLRRKHYEDENRRIHVELLGKEHARARAEEESRFKSGFLSTMSHELRTPLNSIIGFSELLEQEMPGPLNVTQKEFVGNVLLSSRHLLALINDVLDISKIEAGRMQLAREWVVFAQLVEAVRGIIWPLASQRQISLEIDVAADLPKLFLDPMRVKQILYNLFSNAIKFTPAGGHVRLDARAEDGGLRLVVSDTGIGISSEDVPRLFREFERIDTPASETTEGTGLGLVLTRRLAELHGGAIEVESEVGRGSSFIVRLPATSRAAGTARMELSG